MATAKKALGRGLSALIPDSDMEFLSRVARGDTALTSFPTNDVAFSGSNTINEPSVAQTRKETESLSIKGESILATNSTPKAVGPSEDTPLWIEVQRIEANPYQPRRVFADEEMRDLVASIQEHGIIQPVLVRPAGNADAAPSQFQLIAGERRWRAAQAAGLTKIPAVVRQVNDQQALELALIENVQRHDISAMDAAKAYRRLADEFALSQEDIARRVGKSRPSIANTMRLLDLPAEAQKAIEDGTISEGHGRAILLAPGDGARRAVLRRILRDKVTVREAEELSRKSLSASDDEPTIENKDSSKPRLTGVEMRALRATEEELSIALGTKVRVRPRSKGGRILIEYFSAEDLDQLLGRLRGAHH